MKIFESDHDYYCSDQNYDADPRSDRIGETFESVDEFLAEWGNADKSYNLVFRWDYKPADPEDAEFLEPGEVATNDFYIFVMQQRKGRFWPITILNVQPDDEPKLHAWLLPRWEHMKSIWAPFT